MYEFVMFFTLLCLSGAAYSLGFKHAWNKQETLLAVRLALFYRALVPNATSDQQEQAKQAYAKSCEEYKAALYDSFRK